MTALVCARTGRSRRYPAVYLWNQDPSDEQPHARLGRVHILEVLGSLSVRVRC